MDGRRGWLVVFGGFVTLALTSGMAFFVVPGLLAPIERDTGWSFEQLSNAMALWALAAALFSPIVGSLIDRLGARRMILFGIVLGAAVIFLTARATQLWQLYTLMIVAAIGAMSCTYIPVASVVARWFVKHRAVATGVAMLGTFAGGTVFPLAVTELLARYSWRETYMIFGFVLASAAVPALLFIRNPNEEEETAYLAKVGSSDHDAGDLTLGEALRGRSFWGLSIGDGITGLVFAIFNTHLVYYLTKDLGSERTAAQVFGALNLCTAAGTLILGAMGDRMGLRRVFVPCYLGPVLAVPLLLSGGAPMAFAFAVVAGLPAGGRNGLFPTALVYCFGEKHLGAIYGMSNTSFMIGNALGPVISSRIFEYTGGTRAVYLTCIALLLVSTALVSLIQRKPTKK